MMNTGLSSWMNTQIRDGKAILFLGSGATIGAITPSGKHALTTEQLRDKLCDIFLDGDMKSSSLSIVSDYAISVSCLRDVQEVILNEFKELQPTDFHHIIPQFRWKAIFTTNYDLILERAYENTTNRLQTLVPVIRDSSNLREVLGKHDVVPYIKLHGCITCIDDSNLPLILASEQYARYEKNRKNLFELLREYGERYPIFFCGYKIEDPNIQLIFFDLNDKGVNRPRYVLIRPNLTTLEERFWQGRRVDAINSTFETFLKNMNKDIPIQNRMLSALISAESLSITKWFRSNQSPSEELSRYLQSELEHVHSGVATEGIFPEDFYNGLTHSWDIFRDEYDIRRRVTDDIILEWILEENPTDGVRIHLLRGHAGSGKNVTLRRVAWESATDHNKLILYLKEGAIIRNHLIAELSSLVQDRLILFIDDVVKSMPSITALIDYCRRQAIDITIIAGARTNEWNVYGTDLAPLISGEYELQDLSRIDIEALLKKLEQHNCLGHLFGLNLEDRIHALHIDADRQLLVALHEATSGKKFEDLVYDEYNNVVPDEARILYLDICTLHRLGVPVRAGLIHRVSGISFSDFKDHFFKPLEHVVRTFEEKGIDDWVYRSRHPLIAKFVFERALNNPDKKVNQIIRIMNYMNVEYNSDDEAFSKLIEGRSLAEEFNDRRLADKIYDIAEKTGADSAFIAHQRSVFEINHRSGSTKNAMMFIRKAKKATKYHKIALEHTEAMVLRKMALSTDIELEQKKYRDEAKAILIAQIQDTKSAYSYSGLVQIYLDELKDLIKRTPLNDKEEINSLTDRVLLETISNCSEVLEKGLQRLPEEDRLLSQMSNFATLLRDKPAAKLSLEKAFKLNPRNDVVAVRLARLNIQENNVNQAIEILKTCISENQTSKTAHFELAKTYMILGEEENKEIITHNLFHSFTHGDTNYLAQLNYARHMFLYGDKEKAEETFNLLSKQSFPPSLRNKSMEVVTSSDNIIVEYHGSVKNLTNSYCFVRVAALNSDIFIYYNELSDSDWQNLKINSYVSFNLAFSLRGPRGVNAKIIS